MRPSRFFARTPQPAGHSRQTVANHEATPGTICSFGTKSGRMDSVACWQPPGAEAQRERRRDGPGADVVQEGVRQASPRLGGEGGHGLDRPMACLTPEARAHVRLVREVGELGKLVDSYPGNRFLLRVVLGDLLDLRQGRASDLVAAHTALDGRQPRVLRAARL